MLVFMAVVAALKLNFVKRVFAFRDMTLGAFDGEVLPFKRIGGCCVVFYGKRRRFETVHGVAGRALAGPGPLGKLAVMRIGLVAIHALGERNRLFEIASCMASRTIYVRVLAEQWIFGFRVIEVAIYARQRNSLPAFCTVTRLTTLRETAVMWIGMAIRALGKRDSGIARFAGGIWRVTFFTLHLNVSARQWISRLGVIKLANRQRFPIGVVMALLTVRAQTSLVRILVASGAGLRNAQKTARQILGLDRRARRRIDMVGTVAAGAGYPGMFAFENIAGELVIENFRIPLDERKILAIVFGVAARTPITCAGRNVVGSV